MQYEGKRLRHELKYYINEVSYMKKISEIWAKHIILGDKKYSDVPNKLKEYVKQCLIEKGRPDLVNE